MPLAKSRSTISAKLLGVPYEATPGYDIDHPVESLYSYGFEVPPVVVLPTTLYNCGFEGTKYVPGPDVIVTPGYDIEHPAETIYKYGFEDDGERPSGVWSFWTLAPALLVAVIVSAATQTSAYSLLPVFGAGYGLAEARLAVLVTCLSIGNIILQIPLGFLAERFGGRPMIIACALTLLALETA